MVGTPGLRGAGVCAWQPGTPPAELGARAYLAFLKKRSELFTVAVSKRTTEKERPWTNTLGNRDLPTSL